jgi:hypothetical protein
MNNKAIKLRQELLGGVKTNIIQFEGSNPDNRIKNSRFIFQKQESGGVLILIISTVLPPRAYYIAHNVELRLNSQIH